MQPADVNKLEALVTPVLARMGYELVDLRLLRDGRGWVVQVFLDAPGGVTIDDCARVSRDLGAALDVEDPVRGRYSLEVSSPGLDRPLRSEEHFRRFAGSQVKIRTREPIEGRRNFSGRLVGAQDGVVRVEVEGKTYVLALPAIAAANLQPSWK